MFLEQKSARQSFMKKNKFLLVLCIILLVVSVCGGIYFFSQERSKVADNAIEKMPVQLPPVQYSTFTDDELGVSFQYPKSWGNAVVKNNFSLTHVMREIIFSNQPNVKLMAPSANVASPADLDKLGISSSADVKSFCESEFNYLSGGSESKNGGGEDMFRQNGAYDFGNCNTTPALLNISQKISTEGGGWIPVDDPKSITSNIELSRSYFWTLQNSIYPALTLLVDVPDISSSRFCTIQFNYGAEGYRPVKKFDCINQKEKESIEQAFKDFDTTQLVAEVGHIVSSSRIYSADKVSATYENYFTGKTVFSDTELGIGFSYPTIFGQPQYDANTRRLSFPNDVELNFQIEVNTLAQTIQTEKESETCDGPCLGPLASSERWKKEKAMLAQGTLGQVKCLYGGVYCEIANVGTNKMLIRYFGEWPRTDGIRKEYVFYLGDKRFDILTHSLTAYTHELTEYRNSEKSDLTLKLLQEIVDSIQVKK